MCSAQRGFKLTTGPDCTDDVRAHEKGFSLVSWRVSWRPMIPKFGLHLRNVTGVAFEYNHVTTACGRQTLLLIDRT